MENITTFYYRYLRYIQAKDDSTATPYDKFMALSYAVRSQMVDKWISSQKQYHEDNPRRVYFMSMEYVFGKSLRQNIINLDLEKSVLEAAENLGFSLEELYDEEEDFELGNAGIGRLAASLVDSMATLGLPAMAYGLHYDYAVFRQVLKNGMQHEQPNDWLHKGHPWEIKRPEYSCSVQFNGKVKPEKNIEQEWIADDAVIAEPFDYPIPGFCNDTVNTLRLWAGIPSEEFLPDYSNHGDYVRACEEKFQSGRITNYLIPDDDIRRATEMRIKQQYFFVSASLQDIIRRYKLHNSDITNFDEKVVIQLNGSKCAIAIAEFMRLLVDEEKVPWKKAWSITQNVFTYTSHAVSFENLERWPVYIVEEILPRHLQIIYDINEGHLNQVRGKGKYNDSMIRELSIIEEGEVKWIRMAHLAVLGSFSINGVSRAQSDILKNNIFNTFSDFIPGKLRSVTNGVALRRWLICANKPLAGLITDMLGTGWMTDFEEVKKLESFKDDPEVIARLGDIKHAAKRHLQAFLAERLDIAIDADTFFDVHTRKIHPFKRQMLHILYILRQYLVIKNGGDLTVQRTHIFGGKATPSDFLARQIIHLINIVVEIIKNDPDTANKMNVVFVPNYNLTLAEKIIPAADLSEHLSAPGYEASGTSNMKFAVNGASIIGSPSGSNLELEEKLGSESFVMFGHAGDELKKMKSYNPWTLIEKNDELQAIFKFLDETIPIFPDGNLVNPLLATLRDKDQYLVLRDYTDYIKKQDAIDKRYHDRTAWHSQSLVNVARAGWLSSDRVVGEYATKIWKL